MANSSFNPDQSQGRLRSPQGLAILIGDIVKCGVVIVFWLLVALITVAGAVIIARSLLWAVMLASRALGTTQGAL